MLGASALACLAVELFFRLFVPVTGVPYFFWDPAVGPRRSPYQSGEFIRPPHIRAPYHFNDDGWNHPHDYVVAKPPGTLRVALVGDSFVEALQVPAAEAMFTIAEHRMNRSDRRVQWYAFGNSGWGTTQQFEVIRHIVLDYRPDVVVLLFVENDLFDSSPYLMPIEPYIATYSLDEAGELLLHRARFWRRAPWKRLLIESDTIRYFVLQRGVLDFAQPEPALATMPLRAGSLQGEGRHIPGIDDLSFEERQKKSWQLIGKVLEAARDECALRGARFIVAFRGNLPAIEAALHGWDYEYPDPAADPYCLGDRRYEMGQVMLAPLCAQLDIPFLDLTEPLIANLQGHATSHIFENDGHYNAAGHRAAGETLAGWIESLKSDEVNANQRSH